MKRKPIPTVSPTPVSLEPCSGNLNTAAHDPVISRPLAPPVANKRTRTSQTPLAHANPSQPPPAFQTPPAMRNKGRRRFTLPSNQLLRQTPVRPITHYAPRPKSPPKRKNKENEAKKIRIPNSAAITHSASIDSTGNSQRFESAYYAGRRDAKKTITDSLQY